MIYVMVVPVAWKHHQRTILMILLPGGNEKSALYPMLKILKNGCKQHPNLRPSELTGNNALHSRSSDITEKETLCMNQTMGMYSNPILYSNIPIAQYHMHLLQPEWTCQSEAISYVHCLFLAWKHRIVYPGYTGGKHRMIYPGCAGGKYRIVYPGYTRG